MSIISRDKLNHNGWSNAGGGLWVDTTSGELAFNVDNGIRIGTSEFQNSSNKISDAGSELRNRIIMFQGLVMELQRRAGKTEKFDQGLYGEINQANKALADLTTQLKILMEQVEYTKDIVDATKVSQELAEGFGSKPEINIDWSKVQGHTTIRTLGNPRLDSIVPAVSATQSKIDTKAISDSINGVYNDTTRL